MLRMEEKETVKQKQKNKFQNIDRQKAYEIYGHVRYIVQRNHCEPTTIDDVMNSINNHHYEKIFSLFNYEKELVDYALKYVKSNMKKE